MGHSKRATNVVSPKTGAKIGLQVTTPQWGSPVGDEWFNNEPGQNAALDGRDDFPKAPWHRRLNREEPTCPGSHKELENGSCAECGEDAGSMMALMPKHFSGGGFCAGSQVPVSEDGTCQHCNLPPAAFMRPHKRFNPKYGSLTTCPGSGRVQHPTLSGCTVCGLGMFDDPDNPETRRVTQGFQMERMGQQGIATKNS